METTKQVRRMDDVRLNHELRQARAGLERARAKGDARTQAVLERSIRELNAELTRREALEAA